MEKPIFRYKFSPTYLEEVQDTFISTHRYDDPATFKEAWVKWSEKHDDMISMETRRLQSCGYTGDVTIKMYKSVRYYFKNKPTIPAAPKKRRPYIRLCPNFRSTMDEHILSMKNRYDKPSELYKSFLEVHQDLVVAIKKELLDKGLNSDDIDYKIKKTYKNRCYNL